MEYTDFPILDENDYSIILKNYNAQKEFDRHTCVNKIFYKMLEIKNYCCSIKDIYNNKISSSINTVKQNINKQIENLNSIFSFNISNPNLIYEFNLFSFIKKLFDLLHLLYNWSSQEKKDYYKTLSKSFIYCTIDMCNEIISALESSTVKIFKYM